MQLWGFGPCLACLKIGPRLLGLSAYVVRAQHWARSSSSDDQTQLLLRNRAKYKLSVPFFQSTLLKTELLKDTKTRETFFFVTVLRILVWVLVQCTFYLSWTKEMSKQAWKTNKFPDNLKWPFWTKGCNLKNHARSFHNRSTKQSQRSSDAPLYFDAIQRQEPRILCRRIAASISSWNIPQQSN